MHFVVPFRLNRDGRIPYEVDLKRGGKKECQGEKEGEQRIKAEVED